MEEHKFHFHFVAFFIAFGIGIMYTYLKTPAVKEIVKFPTPFNAGKVVYKDSADTCFVFQAQKTECPKDKTKIKPQPIVE
jgi:hypothetical protein